MRLHRLRVSAFQAFAGTEVVDFDALSAAGLFLLHGNTGAGKTTLLDAIAFALYGEVPGARARDARLRSDHAAPDLRTEVELEATLRDRRVRIVRRPRQERPKRRGDGMTEEGHAATVEALGDDGEWTVLATRPEEARAELADLLGMTCDQFCQVVLLPQGGFAEFLRAPSDERQKVLEQLFGTRRFAEVEWWFRDRRGAARTELEHHLREVRAVVARLAQAAGEEPPLDWEEALADAPPAAPAGDPRADGVGWSGDAAGADVPGAGGGASDGDAWSDDAAGADVPGAGGDAHDGDASSGDAAGTAARGTDRAAHGDGDVRAWAGALSVGAQAGAATAEQAALAARAARSSAEAALAAATELAERRDRHARAAEELARWEQRRSVRDDAERELLTARRAAPVAALLAAAAARAQAREAAAAAAETAWDELGDELPAQLGAALAAEAADAAPARTRTPEAVASGPPRAAEIRSPPSRPVDAELAAAPEPEAEPEPAAPTRFDDAALTLFDDDLRPSAPPPADHPSVGDDTAAAAAHPAAAPAPADAHARAPADGRTSADAAPARSGPACDGRDRDDAAAGDATASAGGEPLDPWSPAAPGALRRHARELRTEAGALGTLVAVEERLAQDESALAELDREAETAAGAVAEATRALETAAAERARLDEDVRQARQATDRLERLADDDRALRERVARARERDRLAARRPAVEDALRAAVDAEQQAHAAWLDLRERRLAGMAAELAAGLRPGEPCAVCGATDHPAPAHASTPPAAAAPPTDGTTPDRAPTAHASTPAAAAAAPPDAASAPARPHGDGPPVSLAELERAAEREHGERAQERAERERAAGELRTALAAATAVAGDASLAQLEERAHQLAAELETVRRQADTLAGAERALAALATTTAGHEQRRRDAEQRQARARAAHGERSAALAGDRARVQAARGDAPSVHARAEALRAGADACEAAASALEHAARARAAHEEAAAAAADAAREAGFDDADSARAAVRDEAALDQLAERLRAFDDALAERRALVQDPQLVAAAQQPAPDVEALRAAAAAAIEQDERSHGRNTVEQRRLADVTRLAGELAAALEQLAPVAEHERRVRELAQLIDGSSASNRLRMRLSAYVLAARLEEVAQAATVRLDRMTNGRYALVHSDEGARGRSRGGLDLRIVDGWTGRSRSPATLSGGESFQASLALALGLADVVAAEAGGSRLETLFIDEGFGSLDERSLDEVLDVLDRLREGGRAVGIVSHVAELRQRIPAQLHVVKGRHGSHVEQGTTAVTA